MLINLASLFFFTDMLCRNSSKWTMSIWRAIARDN